MRECGCKWEGALDGHIIRCQKHAAEYKAERRNTPARLRAENDRLKRELTARGLGWVVRHQSTNK